MLLREVEKANIIENFLRVDKAMEEKMSITKANAKSFDNVLTIPPVIPELDEKRDDVQGLFAHSSTTPQRRVFEKKENKLLQVERGFGLHLFTVRSRNSQK